MGKVQLGMWEAKVTRFHKDIQNDSLIVLYHLLAGSLIVTM